MIKKTVFTIGSLVLLLICVLLFNTFRTSPWPVNASTQKLQPLPDSAVQHMSQAVQIPTISTSDSLPIDTAAFKSFVSFIEHAYPLVHRQLLKKVINQFSLVFEWKGQNTGLAPIILMGHYDVVPVETSVLNEWKVPPFRGTIADSCIWGRGSVDDKCGVISILEATEAMLHQGFIPQRTIYLCFGHDEEIRGRSALAVVQYLQQKNVQPEMVLDEGGEITEQKIKEIKRPIALIGVAEKGNISFELSIQQEGGHSSTPAKETAIDILATALYKLRNNPTPAKLTPPVKEFLTRISSSSNNFLHRVAGANMWLFEDMVKGILSSKPEGNALIRTTIAPVIIQSGLKENVIPAYAKAIVNCRILPGETYRTVEDYIRNTINDGRVIIKNITKLPSEPSSATSFESVAFKRVESAVDKNVLNVITTPYLDVGATDSRYYRLISKGVVNFLPVSDGKGFHGVNERLPLHDLQLGINFIMTIIQEANKDF